MTSIVKFPFNFDTARLQTDAEKFAPAEWISHFNTHIYQGDWSGIALRSSANAHVALYPDPSAENFVDTDLMARCTYVPKVLSAFECELKSVRFLKLAAGAVINKHRDYMLGLEDGEIRIHIPVLTNPQVEFILDDQKVEMQEGEAWYLNFNLFHTVRNEGTTDRIHLVIDCVVNDWMLSNFPAQV